MNAFVISCDNERVVVQLWDGGIPFAVLTAKRQPDPNHFVLDMKYDREQVDGVGTQPVVGLSAL